MKTILGKKIPFTGGGYFRLLPYHAITKMMQGEDYIMSYFHLRDFDTKQKVVLSPRYFKSYYGIKSMLHKMEKFIGDHKFITVKDAGAGLNNISLNTLTF
jgi:hypothetical protein